MTTLTAPTVLDQLKALAQDTRYDLVRHLAQGEHCVCDLEALLNLPQSKVSYHLGILKEAGLVTAEQRGKNMYYALRREPLFYIGGQLLADLFPDHGTLTHQPKSVC
ncbi:ArsR/SmtB family transcription factor [Deinococcus multiflagellatus]|uniref:ArsR/SmtB family transcription factor n=1 Tax=Deinococcus multiflagellatus TaxID=1656887 RepID=A0ABW1ZT00_9DEIO|nr:metalloregulator ArsR/SmtB family transcription factor [Deinococcus multiflagellatus]MBZ9715661.1 metalloregulator ArsR/SmtB family transcription factor [Deinococcus multiflagellatus]